jgi:hypothetical protein
LSYTDAVGLVAVAQRLLDAFALRHRRSDINRTSISVFPSGCGVFKAGGDLAYHHGGLSLQELIVPILTIRTKVRDSARPSAETVMANGLPEAVTNRIFSVALQFGDQNLSLFSNELVVRPLLMSTGKQVGAVGMAIDAEFDRATGCVKLRPGKPTIRRVPPERRECGFASGSCARSHDRRGAVPIANRHPSSTWSLKP